MDHGPRTLGGIVATVSSEILYTLILPPVKENKITKTLKWHSSHTDFSGGNLNTEVNT